MAVSVEGDASAVVGMDAYARRTASVDVHVQSVEKLKRNLNLKMNKKGCKYGYGVYT